MEKWSAVAEIVTKFVDAGKPNHALLALLLLTMIPLAVAALISLGF